VIQSNGTAAYWFHVLGGASLTITDSTIRDCGWNDTEPGLVILADGARIFNGTFTDCPAGMVFFGASNAKVENSTFYGNTMGGIGIIDGSNGNYIANNSFDSGEGVHIENASYNTILANTMSNCDYGIYVAESMGDRISNNTISAYDGIYMDNADNNTIYNNDITFGNNKYNGLVAYWRLDEHHWTGAWGEVRDSSGNGHDGHAQNGADTTADGYIGRAGDFDGVNDWVYVPDSSALDLTGDMTVEAWINADTFQRFGGIVGKYQSASANGFTLRLSPNAPYNTIDFCDVTGSTPLTAGQWYHVAAVMQGNTAMIYVNGVLDTSGTPPWTRQANWNPVSIGGDFVYGGGRYFDGRIDDVWIYNRALSQEEINQTYNNYLAAGIYMKDSPNNDVSFDPAVSDISGYGDIAIYLDNSSPSISYVNMHNSLQGLVCVNGSSPLLLDSQIWGDVPDDVYVSGNSHPVLRNSTFNKDQTYVIDEPSNLTVEWYLDAYVRDSGGIPVSGAWVNLTDRQGEYFSVGTTDSGGHVGPLILREYVQNWTKKNYYSPYNVYADDGVNYGSEPVLLDSSKSVYITINLRKVWNNDQQLWYSGIQPAVVMANLGDHLWIYGGLHNESVLVDKAVHIMGVVSPLPVVNGNGSGPSFAIVSEGVEILNLNITNTGMPGIYAKAGGFDIHDNLFYTDRDAIYVDIYHYREGSMDIGDMSIYRNHIEAGGRGIGFSRIQFDHPLPDSVISVGQIRIDDNWINTTTRSGIGINIENTQYLYGTTSVNMEGISATGNHIGSSSESFYLYMDYAGYHMYNTSSFRFGNINIDRNDFNSSNSDAICLEIEDSGYFMYNHTVWSLGTVNMTGNTLSTDPSSWGYGIDSYIYECAEEMYDDSFATFGTWNIVRNNITGRYGIYTGPGECGYSLYGNAELILHDWNIMYNNIGVDIYGLEFDYYDIGEEMYDNSRVTGGNNFIMYNDVRAEARPAYYLYYDYIAYDMYDSSYVSMGHTETSHNTFVTNASYSMYMEIYENGVYMGGDSEAHIGDFIFTDNDVSSNTSYGIYFDYWEANGYRNMGNSYAEFGDVLVNNNTVTTNKTTGRHGIYLSEWDYNGAYLMDFATVVFGDFEVNGNTINSGREGIYVEDWYAWGYSLSYDWWAGEPQASACHISMGHVQFNGNSIDSTGIGIYMEYFGDMAERMYGSSTFEMENFEMCYNTINSSSDAMYPDYFYYLAYDMYDRSNATFGDFLFNWNTVTNASGYAFYFDYLEDLAEEMYGSSVAIFGDFEFNNNTMHSTDAGVYVYNEYWGYSMYDSSEAYFGHFQMNDNDVNTTGAGNAGMDMDSIYEFGYEMYDNSYFEMGDVEICRNTIRTNTSGNGNGIEVDVYEMGAYMSDNSEAIFHDFLFNENTILSGGAGIYFDDFSYVGYDMDDYSIFEMGDVEINNNDIAAGEDGIYFIPYELGAYMYYGSQARIGTNYILNNTITAADGYGIYSWWWYSFGYALYENARLEVGDAVITHNDVSSDGSGKAGICTGADDAGIYVYDFSAAIFGDYVVSYNTVVSNQSAGIEFYLYYIGYELDQSSYSTSSSYVIVGDSYLEGNNIAAATEGIYMESYYVGANMYYDSWAQIGDVFVRNNTMDAYDGLYAEIDYTGYEMYDHSTVTIGALDISGNTVTANDTGGVGIYLYIYGFAYSNQDSSNLSADDIFIHDNTVTDSYIGLDIEYHSCGVTSDNAYAKIPGTYAYDNDVTASNWGLYLRGDRNPRNYAGGTQVWGGIEVYDSTFNSGNGTYLWSDTISTEPKVWIHDVRFTQSGPANSTNGIFATNGAATFERCSFSGYDQGIYSSGSDLTVGSSSFVSLSSWDINMTNAAHVFMVDDTFDKSNVLFQDNDSVLDIGWYITVNVITQTGNGVPYASVRSVSNLSAPTVFWNNFTVDGNGQKTLMLREYRQNITGIIEQYNYYNMTGTKGGLTGYLSPDPTPIDSSKDVYILLTDTDPPVLGEDTSDTSGTTGDPFTFRVNATDNIGIDYVTVYCRYGTGAYQSAVMSSSDNITWEYTMNLASNYVGTVEYYFVATDLAGNTATGNTSSFPERDNDAPSGLVDNSPGVLTSPSYTFNMTISDNIGVTGVYVVYMFNTESPTNISMSGTGPYTATITRAYADNTTLSYYFTTVDAAGNWFNGPIKTISMEDTTPPVICNDTSDTAGTTGDPFTFRVNVTDDFSGVDSVVVLYWFDGEEALEVVMGGNSGMYSATITLPFDRIGTLHYLFNATDVAGNYVMSAEVAVNVTDNDAPVLSDATIGAPIQGDTFTLIAEADDNIGVTSVTVEYWFDDGGHETANMTQIGNVWVFFLHIPTYASELHYVFNASDSAGNTAVTGETTLATVEPVDEEPPMIADTTTSIPILERPFTFSAIVTDNVQVADVSVEYWFDNGTHTNASMTDNGGSWELTISVPADASELHYIIRASDNSENGAYTTERTLAVEEQSVDTVPPQITDATSGTPVQGSEFTISAVVTDNVEVSAAYVEYWFDNGTHQNMSMTYDTEWTYTLIVPFGATTLHYIISARDSSMNWNSIDELSLSIIPPPGEDTTQPTLGNLTISGDVKEGETISFSIYAQDNGGVAIVYVVYTADDGTEYRALLSGTNGGTYTGKITVPSGSRITYHAVAEDMAGNTARTADLSADIEPSQGTISPGGNTTSDYNLLFILIIVLLLAVIGYLAATRNRKESETTMAAESSVETEEVEETVEDDSGDEEYEVEDTAEEGGDDTDDISDLLEEEE